MNVEKMRRNLARQTPDAVWMTLDISRDDATQIYEKWRDHWMTLMRIKHGKERPMKLISSYETVLLDMPHHVRVQLVIR